MVDELAAERDGLLLSLEKHRETIRNREQAELKALAELDEANALLRQRLETIDKLSALLGKGIQFSEQDTADLAAARTRIAELEAQRDAGWRTPTGDPSPKEG
jgi:hypothetical protein